MSVAAAAPLAAAGPAAGLGRRVIPSEPAASLRLPAFRAERMTMLTGLLGLAVRVACLSWVHIVVVRPLRELARLAERLAGGDRRTVLYPVNHDETGSVTRSLELIRQAPPTAPGNRSSPTRAGSPPTSSCCNPAISSSSPSSRTTRTSPTTAGCTWASTTRAAPASTRAAPPPTAPPWVTSPATPCSTAPTSTRGFRAVRRL
ncbi:HAMP domain-containing protein [Streptomyces caelestis]|uniref:HAMP domain-containing protein n=2 Tax=Streptomyces caelestis TaxID=36816 RepID=A0A7W9LR81_9ACTN|nr:HAMP domain-containing protein [Streptomyces caelestis]MBB5793047.1 HAMP domain-containing protein [Streptomyces caelestis]